MDPLSKSMQETRDSDEARLRRDRELLEDLRPILGSPGMSRLIQILRQDWQDKEELASATYESVLNPIPIQAQAVKQYIASLIERLEQYKNIKETPGE